MTEIDPSDIGPVGLGGILMALGHITLKLMKYGAVFGAGYSASKFGVF